MTAPVAAKVAAARTGAARSGASPRTGPPAPATPAAGPPAAGKPPASGRGTRRAGTAAGAGTETNQDEEHPVASAAGASVGRGVGRGVVKVGRAADSGAGVLLGLMLWSLTMAYLNPSGKGRGGLTGVKDLLRAKFLNKGTDGERLP